MFARSTTFNGNPAALDAGMAYISDEVMPQITSMDGCIGLSMMANRDSGRCIATSSWSSVEAMRAADGALRPIRARGGEILGASPLIEEWEVAIMHREHTTADGACTRVTWLETEPAGMDHAIDVFRMSSLARLDEIEGFCSASMFVDRRQGRCVVTSTYDSRKMLAASRPIADTIRTSSMQEIGGDIVDIAEFELVLAHLHVPETA